jgi:hypothetical protein
MYLQFQLVAVKQFGSRNAAFNVRRMLVGHDHAQLVNSARIEPVPRCTEFLLHWLHATMELPEMKAVALKASGSIRLSHWAV